MEIERKYLIDRLPFDVTAYPSHEIEQAYLNTEPVIRIRKEDEEYYLTYKSKGLMAREEYNLPLNAESYAHLLQKAVLGQLHGESQARLAASRRPFDNRNRYISRKF